MQTPRRRTAHLRIELVLDLAPAADGRAAVGGEHEPTIFNPRQGLDDLQRQRRQWDLMRLLVLGPGSQGGARSHRPIRGNVVSRFRFSCTPLAATACTPRRTAR